MSADVERRAAQDLISQHDTLVKKLATKRAERDLLNDEIKELVPLERSYAIAAKHLAKTLPESDKS